jgi:hypothetical protein
MRKKALEYVIDTKIGKVKELKIIIGKLVEDFEINDYIIIENDKWLVTKNAEETYNIFYTKVSVWDKIVGKFFSDGLRIR